MDINRRELLRIMAGGAAITALPGCATSSRPAGAENKGGMVTTNQILEHMLSKSPWVRLDKTVDCIKAGNGDKVIRKAGVGWMSSIENLRAAHEDGCELFITHEPTFWDHRPEELMFRGVEPGISKQKFLDETGMVVLRLHDTWDNWPKIGIRDSWADCLGLTKFVGENPSRWHAAYDIEPVPLKTFAKHVANRVKRLGEDSVQVIGDPERIVSRPSIGVGCGGPAKDMVDIGSDVLIVCFDGASYWRVRQRMAELGAAVITVEHGSSEMPGIENLAKYLDKTYDEIEVKYYDLHCRPWTVMA
ncbi:Nif3-like dinuclear metal center hexameric protein [Candidatus Hydrogenedentota bacterium]